MTEITIESLEALVEQIAGEQKEQREKQLRMIAACARIVALQAPKKFSRQACRRQDEEGHFDNSFPPSIDLVDFSGPRLYCVYEHSTEDVATSTGFYHSWKRVTKDQGLYVSRSGVIYGCEETGTGRRGQYAAYPGDCDVDCDLSYSRADLSEISAEHLAQALKELSEMAFPLATAAIKARNEASNE